MGRPWREHESWELVEEASAISGRDVGRLLLDADADELKDTRNAQLTTFVSSLMVLDAVERLGIEPSVCAGHSLGEYTALCAAGAFSLADTARLLKLRGQSMQAAVPVGVGAMAALLGADIDKATRLSEAAAEGEVCTVANDNDPSQVVLSGHKAAIERAVAMVKDFEIKRGVLLPVSAPFHCPLMQPAADAMAETLAKTPPGALSVPLFANVTAAVASEPADVQRLLVEQVCGRVRWRESVIAMKEAGVDSFVELGGKVLGPMIGRSVTDVSVTSVVGMADIEALLAAL